MKYILIPILFLASCSTPEGNKNVITGIQIGTDALIRIWGATQNQPKPQELPEVTATK